jgi:MFS family permease
MLFNVARAVGPLLAGPLLEWVDPGLCFFLNSFSFVAVIAALAMMRIPAVARAPGKHVGLRAILSAFGDLGKQPTLALLLALVAVVSVFGWPSQSLLPALAQKIGVSEGARGYSLLLCGAGTGAVAAALVVASFTAPRWRRPLLCCGIGLTVTGLIGLALVLNLGAAVGFNCLVGFGLILFMATSQSVVQLSVDDLNRGRIMGIWSMVLSGAVPLGNLLAGPAADRWDVPSVLVVQGLGCGLAFVVALCLLRFGSKGDAAAR